MEKEQVMNRKIQGRVKEKDNRILKYIQDNPTATTSEISAATGISASTVSKRVATLIKEGKLIRHLKVLKTNKEKRGFLFDVAINPLDIMKLGDGGMRNYDDLGRSLRDKLADMPHCFVIEHIWTKFDGGLLFAMRLNLNDAVWARDVIKELTEGRSKVTLTMISFWDD